ncbi:acyclic terpene utilization AtuA family protein [Paenibacillus sp. 1011MAR3C5]|uniref:acyclic terpene utilization AtuA family protein n=1 Tax=Paenibacillus sp. 1011MAR3C5 TaxID=1675787 RepID=UPI000E6D1CF9|nr:acyclic terpene utilization AtuA family protein [Paenibacillus sp. 1011MAR3C5]RJE85155.1 acyclic terpene utilization AtuA family protein [Paenibacillus sp. 1011MAR3C5]
MNTDIRILSPCGMLGYGFPEQSFLRGMEQQIHGIVVDAGSTDAGPHKLGAGVSIVSKRAAKKDLDIMIASGVPRGIPIIIGSAGGSGAAKHVNWTLDIIQEILQERDLQARISVIWADFTQEEVLQATREGRIHTLSPNIPPLDEAAICETNSIVAQMGHEPIVEALRQGADIIVCGRAYDPSPFAAIGIYHGKDPGLSYHLGKILECGALCAEPGTTKDSILGTITEDAFLVQSLNPARKCSPTSVAAHTFYEKEHPYILHGPGFTLDLEHCRFEEQEEGVVRVTGSRYIPAETYKIKLEGARLVAYRTFVVAGIRDPILIGKLEEIEALVKQGAQDYYNDIPVSDYSIHFYNYGVNGVLGDKEPETFRGHEVGVMFEVVAKTQELASSLCATVRSTFLHYGYEGRKSTAGNLAFPFAPSDIEFGPVYEFSVYHLMEMSKESFRIERIEFQLGEDRP